jgi:predicted lysophospholipase L1 biosynthesis ABC-type transport system permease subunit
LFPQLPNGDVQPLADGAIAPQVALNRMHSDNESRYLVARVAPGVSPAQVEQRITHTAPFSQVPAVVGEVVSGTSVPPEVDRLRHVAWFPPAVAILVGTLALIAVAHALITSVRRRRQELAILKALGFARGQVRSTVAWEATTIAVVGFVIGIPAGVLIGRYAWGLAADSVRVASAWSLPVLGLALVVPCALLLVNAVSFLPARAAANATAADALASE